MTVPLDEELERLRSFVQKIRCRDYLVSVERIANINAYVLTIGAPSVGADRRERGDAQPLSIMLCSGVKESALLRMVYGAIRQLVERDLARDFIYDGLPVYHVEEEAVLRHTRGTESGAF